MVCEKVFQEEGIAADVTLSEYPLDFIPFDSDILSLELDGAYKVSGDPTAFLSPMTVDSNVGLTVDSIVELTAHGISCNV